MLTGLGGRVPTSLDCEGILYGIAQCGYIASAPGLDGWGFLGTSGLDFIDVQHITESAREGLHVGFPGATYLPLAPTR